MARMTLICLLLFSGTFLVEASAQTTSTIMLKDLPDFPIPVQANIPAPSNTTTPAPSNTTTHTPSNTTTHAPSNTTTHAPSNTTTHAPSNTTTHAPSNTTTHAPSNTTTHAPSNTTTSNTTSHTTTHVIPTLPPTSGPPEIGNYTVEDSKGACIIADMGLELQIDLSVKGKTDKRYLNIKPKETNANGTCGDSKSNLILHFPEGSINFIFFKESKTYYIEEVSVQLDVPSAGRFNGTSGKLKLLSTDVGYSVACKRTPKVNLGNNLELVLAEVKLQAFDIKDRKLGKESVCFPDRSKLLIPVGVALAIVGLILIILVVFLLTRRRRISGYEQI